jgi:TIR domain
VAEERRAAAELIEQELAKREAFRKTLKLDVFRYEDPNSDTPFLADRSPQASVDQRLGSMDADIIVAILWARMGTPVRDPSDPAKILYQSGTEQEIEQALKAGREVLVYFRSGQPPAPDDDDALEKYIQQRGKVRAFRERLERRCSINDYRDIEDFKRKLTLHLDQLLTRIRDASFATAREPQLTTFPAPPTSDPPSTLPLAASLTATTVRAPTTSDRPGGETGGTPGEKEHTSKRIDGGTFISYRRKDEAAFAGRIYDRLLRDFGGSVFMDVGNIPPGVDFVDYLSKRVEQCDIFLAVIGKKWRGKRKPTGEYQIEDQEDFVRVEIAAALEQEKRVIPLLIGDIQFPKTADLPTSIKSLARKQAVRITHDNFNSDMQRFIDSLKGNP